MRIGKGKEALSKTVGQLLDYTRTHFQQEEELMKRSGYADLAPHQAMHSKFVADIEGLIKQAQEGHAVNSIQVLNMLRDWLVNHIQKVDKQYSAHLNAAGIH